MPNSQENQEEKENQRPGKEYLYTSGTFPCLVKYGAEIEEQPSASDLDQYYHVNARNALRNLTYGTPLFKGHFLRRSNLKLAWLYFKTLFLKSNKRLLGIVREEVKFIFEQALVISEHCDPAAEKQLDIFIDTLLSSFPFMDPEDGELVRVPQKINNQWCLIDYQFKKIDLSPKTGWWSRLIEEEDRLYAYGLEPQSDRANPYLLLMGTTYFSGQGSGLSLLGGLTAGQSIGERHDLTDLEPWILQHHDIKISGTSQGGTMGFLVGAKYPDHVLLVISLNPAALNKTTLYKLLPHWQASRPRHPELRGFIQVGDPVFIIGDSFLPGTQLIHVNHSQSAKDSLFSIHAHNYSGHQSAHYKELTVSQLQLYSNKRKFLNQFKWVADRMVGPLLSFNIGCFIIKRKVRRFGSRQARLLQPFLFFIWLSIGFIQVGMSSIFGVSTLMAILGASILIVGRGFLERRCLEDNSAPSFNASTSYSFRCLGNAPSPVAGRRPVLRNSYSASELSKLSFLSNPKEPRPIRSASAKTFETFVWRFEASSCCQERPSLKC